MEPPPQLLVDWVEGSDWGITRDRKAMRLIDRHESSNGYLVINHERLFSDVKKGTSIGEFWNAELVSLSQEHF